MCVRARLDDVRIHCSFVLGEINQQPVISVTAGRVFVPARDRQPRERTYEVSLEKYRILHRVRPIGTARNASDRII